ncbi:MAG: DUF4349 domain-containing protein [SAR202 cluster bacterium]|nr:DUF4349 domain-containing protein [SAR202 cluster bacterium]
MSIINKILIRKAYFIIVLISLIMVGCSSSSNDSREDSFVTVSSPDMFRSEAISEISINDKDISSGSGYSNSNTQSKIQVNGSLSLEVTNLDSAILNVKNIIAANSGMITSSNSGYSDQPYININILIPRSEFDSVLEDIKQISSIVNNENIYTNDVTEEYIDIESRLNVMLETEKRFLSLLETANKIEEIVQVEKELMRIRGEIDSLTGRIKYLTTTTENSQLNLYMIEEMPISGSDDWNIGNSFDDSLRTFISFLKNIADFLIGILVFTPILIILGLIGFLGYKFISKRKSN